MFNLKMKRLNYKSTILICLISIAICLPSNIYGFSECKEVQKFEGELSFGFTTPIGAFHAGSPEISLLLGLELRRNIKNTPFDAGIMLQLSGASRGNFNHGQKPYRQNNRTLAFAPTFHYNFQQGHKINPFAGCAVGIAHNDVVGNVVYPGSYTSLIFAPRFGVEFFHFLRISGEFNVTRKGYHNFALYLGLVLGGRAKKQKYDDYSM